MNKKWLRRILAMAMVFSLAAGSWVTGYADDGEGNIVISGDGVYEVEAGKTTKIELQVKNKGTGTAENVNLQPRVSSGVAPFRVKMQGNGDLGDMGANAYKKVTLQVTVDGDVQERSYSLPIEYTYSSRGGSARSGSMTIYLKMKGFDLEPGFAFRDMKLSPEDMSPGSSARLSGRLMNTGRVDMTRTVAVTGSEVLKPAYTKLRVGALLTSVFAGNVTKDKELRYISGNVLTGKQVSPNGFLGAFHSQVSVIPEGNDIHEMLGWIMPRFNQFSVNHSYFSWLLGKKEYTIDARIKGGERHMIMSGEYDKVFPMDILPEFLIKAIIAGDIDRMEALGIYEVAPEDFALCEFVDSSKLELQRIVRAGLDMLRAEMM